MAQPPFQIEMMPACRRGMGVLVVLWVLVIGLGLYSLLGVLGVRVPFWGDHLRIRAAWPPVEWISSPSHDGEPR